MKTEPKPISICMSNVSWKRAVPSSKPGQDYLVTYGDLPPDPLRDLPARRGFACSCPAYKFRKDHQGVCKHIMSVNHEWCGWKEGDGGEVVDHKCPKCGGPVVGAVE